MIGTAERAAEFAVVIGVLVVLEVAHGQIVARIEHQPLDRCGAQPTPEVVVMRLPWKRVAPGLGDGADHSAKGSTVFRGDPGGLDLHFLEVFEGRVLPGGPVDDAVGDHAVDRVGVLGAARPVHLEPAFDLALIH